MAALAKIREKRQKSCMDLKQTVDELAKALSPVVKKEAKFVERAIRDINAILHEHLFSIKTPSTIEERVSGKGCTVEGLLMFLHGSDALAFNIYDPKRTERVYTGSIQAKRLTTKAGLKELAAKLRDYGFATKECVSCIAGAAAGMYKRLHDAMEEVDAKINRMVSSKAPAKASIAEKVKAHEDLKDERVRAGRDRLTPKCLEAMAPHINDGSLEEIGETLELMEKYEAVFGKMVNREIVSSFVTRYKNNEPFLEINEDDEDSSLFVSFRVGRNGNAHLTINNGNEMMSPVDYFKSLEKALHQSLLMEFTPKQRKALPGIFAKIAKRAAKMNKAARKYMEGKIAAEI